MTVYSVVLFLHLSGALFLYMFFALEWLVQGRVRKSATIEAARPWLVAGARLPAIGAIGGILIFIPGLWLAAHEKLWAAAWIQAAITTALIMVLMGVVITRPRMRKLERAANEAVPGAAQGTGQTGSNAAHRLRDPVIIFSLRIRMALGFGVLYLMAAKPGLTTTLVTLGVALVLGIVIGAAASARGGAAAA
jgi:hypothetical protein